MFPVIFRLTNYDDRECSVVNMKINEEAPLPFAILSYDMMDRKLSSMDNIDKRINVVVNNILMRMINTMRAPEVSDDMRQKVLMSICEVIYTQEKMISTRRLARIMLYLGALVQVVDVTKQSGYFMGALFSIGGLLKVEARNYLETKKKYEDDFRVVCPL